MTPQEKAKELVDRILSKNPNRQDGVSMIDTIQAKQCALIAVQNEYKAKIEAYNELSEFCPDVAAQAVFYAEKELEEVKQAIQAL